MSKPTKPTRPRQHTEGGDFNAADKYIEGLFMGAAAAVMIAVLIYLMTLIYGNMKESFNDHVENIARNYVRQGTPNRERIEEIERSIKGIEEIERSIKGIEGWIARYEWENK